MSPGTELPSKNGNNSVTQMTLTTRSL